MRIFRKKLKERKKIFIHIGFMKTGTSAIQSFLRTNSSILKDSGFLFPNTNKEAMNYLGFSLLDEIPSKIHHKLPISRENLYKNLVNEINASDHDKIILSTEAFSLISTKYFLGEDAPSMLFEILKDEEYEFSIIAFVRRQDEYLETQYNQHVKTHNFSNLYHNDIFTFYKEKKELFKFNLIIDRWAKIFGEENLCVKVYDKKKNSVVDFLEVLGLSEIPYLDNKQDVNRKLGSKALEFMRIANKYEIEKGTAKQNYLLIKLIEDVLGDSDKSIRLLNNNEANQIMDDFYGENIALSNKYLNGDYSWCLPNKEYLDTNNNKLSSITKEESIKIAAHIWNHFQSKDN